MKQSASRPKPKSKKSTPLSFTSTLAAPSLAESEKRRLEFTRDDPRWWFSWRRVDILLKRVLPRSYNTWPRRYARAIEDLLHVQYKIPGDPRNGKQVYTRETAHEVLQTYAAGSGLANSLIAMLKDAHAAARSAASRDASRKWSATRCRDSHGKFRQRKNSAFS
jgi:hypothetical protein